MARFRVEIPMQHMVRYRQLRLPSRQWFEHPGTEFTLTRDPTRDVLIAEGDAPQDVVTLFMALARGEWPM